jgi:hypothetical protein
MNKDHIKLAAIGGVALVLILATATVAYLKVSKASGHATELEEQLATTKEELASYSKYIDYLPQAKQSVTDSADKLTTTIEDEMTWVERGQKGISPFKLEGNAVLKLSVEYTFGFDLTADKFELVVADKGIQVKLGAVRLQGAPNATINSTEFPPKVLAVAEDAAAQEILEKITPTLEEKGQALGQNDAVRFIAEKKLIQHLRDFFAKQKDIKLVPDIAVIYQ